MPNQSRPGAKSTLWTSNALAWVLALLPLATSPLYILAVSMGVSMDAVSLAALLASAALVVIDKRDLSRTGRIPRSSLPSTAWFLFPPAYLFKRAKRLGGPNTLFWISVACPVLAFIVCAAIVAGIATRLADADPVLPGCADRGSMPDVVSVFDDMDIVRNAGLHGVIVTDQTEVGQGPGASPKSRFCTGVMHASNEREYDMQYAFEIMQGQVIVHVQLQ